MNVLLTILCEHFCQGSFFGQKIFSFFSVLLMCLLVVLARSHLTTTISWPVWQTLDIAYEATCFWSHSGSLGHCRYGLCSETNWARGLEPWPTGFPVCRGVLDVPRPLVAGAPFHLQALAFWVDLCSWDTPQCSTSTDKWQDTFIIKTHHWFLSWTLQHSGRSTTQTDLYASTQHRARGTTCASLKMGFLWGVLSTNVTVLMPKEDFVCAEAKASLSNLCKSNTCPLAGTYLSKSFIEPFTVVWH